VKPTVAPLTCGRLARKPNCAPELKATMFTGPGEIDDANANAAMEISMLIEYLHFFAAFER
jgi:hypothetical protein